MLTEAHDLAHIDDNDSQTDFFFNSVPIKVSRNYTFDKEQSVSTSSSECSQGTEILVE